MSLRVAIVTAEEPFYLPGVVSKVLAGGHRVIAAIVLNPFSPKSGWRETIGRQLMLLGFSGFLRQGFLFALYKALDRFSIGKKPRSVTAACQAAGVTVLRPANINAPEFLEQLRGMKLDVIASISASQIFRKDILALPRLGCINVHSGMLPRYRGMLPSFWVLANGEKEAGVTVHYMNEKLDDGDIILQRAIPVAAGETQHTLLLKTKAAGAELLLEALDRLESGTVEPKPNRAEDATYFTFPTPEEVRRFRAAGGRFF